MWSQISQILKPLPHSLGVFLLPSVPCYIEFSRIPFPGVLLYATISLFVPSDIDALYLDHDRRDCALCHNNISFLDNRIYYVER